MLTQPIATYGPLLALSAASVGSAASAVGRILAIRSHATCLQPIPSWHIRACRVAGSSICLLLNVHVLRSGWPVPLAAREG